MRIDPSRPAIIAHRGASRLAPENTLAAFHLALEQDADAIELDVKLSKDEQVVVMHDRTLDRTTTGSGPVADCSLEELKRLDARGGFRDKIPWEPVPTLLEVLEAFGGQVWLNIELTNYASPTDSLPEKVFGLVNSLNLGAMVLYSSFNPLALMKLRRLDHQASLGLLAYPGMTGAWARWSPTQRLGFSSLHPHYEDVGEPLVRQVHKQGKRLYAYTVNRLEDMQTLFQMGVDGIFTDDPLLGRNARDEFLKTSR